MVNLIASSASSSTNDAVLVLLPARWRRPLQPLQHHPLLHPRSRDCRRGGDRKRVCGLRLALLAPDIVEAFSVDGRPPTPLTELGGLTDEAYSEHFFGVRVQP